MVIPLRRDSNNIFTMKLFIKDQWIHNFAVDTGSHEILVSGRDCLKCAHKGPQKKVVYSSQASTVRVERLPATLEAFRFSCGGDFESFTVPFHQITSSPTSLCLNETNVNVALDFDGTSKYNVLGLGPNSTFLRSLMPRSPRAFSVHIHSMYDAKLLVYSPGRGDCFTARRFLAGRRGIALEAVDGEKDPKIRHVLLDTGSNALSLPEHLYAALPHRGTLRLTLRDLPGEEVILPIVFDKSNVANAQLISTTTADRIVVGVTFLVGYAVGGVQEDGNSTYVTIDRLH